jgi:hypothetical protein
MFHAAWCFLAAEETSTQLKALLASAASKGIPGKALMEAAIASMSGPADGAASIPTRDKQLVGDSSHAGCSSSLI